MIRVLSRDPDRSMLGLVWSVYAVYPLSHCSCARITEYALLERGSEGGNPARVALEGATENQLLGHVCDLWLEGKSTVMVVVGRERKIEVNVGNFDPAEGRCDPPL
jgi:hypothetical protein